MKNKDGVDTPLTTKAEVTGEPKDKRQPSKNLIFSGPCLPGLTHHQAKWREWDSKKDLTVALFDKNDPNLHQYYALNGSVGTGTELYAVFDVVSKIPDAYARHSLNGSK
ncbi:MAG: hypothetical protein SGILL_007781 [Bacillariaceae sp.]